MKGLCFIQGGSWKLLAIIYSAGYSSIKEPLTVHSIKSPVTARNFSTHHPQSRPRIWSVAQGSAFRAQCDKCFRDARPCDSNSLSFPGDRRYVLGVRILRRCLPERGLRLPDRHPGVHEERGAAWHYLLLGSPWPRPHPCEDHSAFRRSLSGVDFLFLHPGLGSSRRENPFEVVTGSCDECPMRAGENVYRQRERKSAPSLIIWESVLLP